MSFIVCLQVANIVVFGKAHKVAGGESQPPRKVLSAPMRKLDKPPHPLKLVEILDWCVQYSEPPAVGRCKLDPGLKAHGFKF